MALTPTNYGDNPQQPSAVAEAYLPDQLIAGDLKVVTDVATITGGADLVRGTLLGQVTLGAPGAAVAAGAGGGGANTGTGAITLIAAGPQTRAGVYTIKYTAAAAFTVTDPRGVQLADGVNGAYADPQLNFTSTAGGTAFVAGDGWTITVGAGSGKYQTCVAAAVDGSQNPCAILVDQALCATSGGDVTSGVYLHGEFNANAMTFGAGMTAAIAKPLLNPIGIFLKNVPVAGDLTAADPS